MCRQLSIRGPVEGIELHYMYKCNYLFFSLLDMLFVSEMAQLCGEVYGPRRGHTPRPEGGAC